MRRGCQVVRVFTRDGAGGNHLGVVNDVSGLSSDAMQAIATDLGFSETVFADWRDISRPPQLRIFTPATELAFAGHPLVGTAWVYDQMGPGGPGELECPAGVVEYRCMEDETWVNASIPVAVDETGDERRELSEASVPEPDAVWTARLPAEYIVARYDSDERIEYLEPESIADPEGRAVYFFHRSGDHVHARFFARELGAFEDPATGSAAVALAHVLRREGEVEGALTIHQGAEMGHPSEIHLRWSPNSVEIGGSVAFVEARFLDV